ncbi:hypothetical protein L210DRAFT_948923, partial [Boletus edulis BED1]
MIDSEADYRCRVRNKTPQSISGMGQVLLIVLLGAVAPQSPLYVLPIYVIGASLRRRGEENGIGIGKREIEILTSPPVQRLMSTATGGRSPKSDKGRQV